MTSLAGMFQQLGCVVSGSDNGIYPPMSHFLESLGIRFMHGYHAENLQPLPDLVVVGNVIRRSNPEAVQMEKSGVPFTSLPAALIHYVVRDRTRIVVAGTHGKTTVSSMIAWILHHEKLDPGFMIGGLPVNFETNHRLGKGRFFVIEGDEYDTSYFDKTPKFLHYRPDLAVVTSCEFDHADIYDSVERIQDEFRAFIGLIPENGSLVAFGEDHRVTELLSASQAPVLKYGFKAGTDWSVQDVEDRDDGLFATIVRQGRVVASGTLPVVGYHNLLNALAAVAIADRVGIGPRAAVNALGSFKGVRRRQELVAEVSGVLIVDDFAHHPTEVKETCSGVHSRFPDRRLVAVFEPRTNTSRRAVFQKSYVRAFPDADIVVLREPRDPEKFPVEDRFSSQALASDLMALGKRAVSFEDGDRILEFLAEEVLERDVVLFMSNGSFDNLASRLGSLLKERRT